MNQFSFFLFVIVAAQLGRCHRVATAQHADLVPPPKIVTSTDARRGWEPGEKVLVSVPDGLPLWEEHFLVVGDALKLLCGSRIELTSKANDGTWIVTVDSALAAEEYAIQIEKHQVVIKASTIKGVAHATATLLQLIGRHEGDRLPCMEIRDAPDCSYRSFMVDLGRNPHGLECLKEMIDLLWFYKVDSLHLHLTDDQRFAFPSKAFPKLPTQRGKLSWEDFEALERYAQVRGVTLIPELEVPGHSTLLRKVYPDIFGKDSTDVARLQSSRDAIKILLDEMIQLFPSSPFIHIGGDEAFGVSVDLQRDLINELHAYLKMRGKKTVVWEGPSLGKRDNKVNEEVIHLNWRTINFPADEMLSAGYPVVNAAWDPLYLVDHYPRNNFTMAAPEHIYNTMNLRRFKHFNPGIKTFLDPVVVQPNDNLIGFCMPWWEGREENYFPMVVPRLIPMAEIAWGTTSPRDFPDFDRRTTASEKTRGKCFYPVTISASPMVIESDGVFHDRTTVSVVSDVGGEVSYTTDGSQPNQSSDRVDGEFFLKNSATIRATAFVDGKQIGHGSRRKLVRVDPIKNLALGKPVETSVPSGAPFSAARLIDGGTGNLNYFLGYPAEPEPIRITIDLQDVVSINRIVTHAFFNNTTFESYEIHLSVDGERFAQIADRRQKPDQLAPSTVHDFADTQARYIRLVTHGCKGYVFDSFSRITEIQVFSVKSENDRK